MRIKLYLFLPHAEAEELIHNGFPDSTRRYRLHPEEYTACSAFNPKSLVEVVLDQDRETLRPYRHELELPVEDEFTSDEEFGAMEAEPIYWYELPARILRERCHSRRIITARES